ncbi:MAG: DUF374 domain-containing protein [Proteobacteria bacterium]|nr:DUF374 domain-containing protein [Pseudomonadota bacterium]
MNLNNIKIKLKQFIKNTSHSAVTRNIICFLIAGYMRLVYYSSRRVFINDHLIMDCVKKGQPFTVAFWHECLFIAPFVVVEAKKVKKDYQFSALASKHGDGQFVSKIVSKFQVNNIYGSSARGRAGRGIDLSNFRKIFRALRKNNGFIITPDGPRGPKRKINGQLVNIAKSTATPIIPASCFTSRYIKLKTWDELMVPLPFSKICYHFGEPVHIRKDLSEEKVEEMNEVIADKLTFSLKECQKAVS